jgi:hypothetical protein
MKLETHFNSYPSLKAAFWRDIENLSWPHERVCHPVLKLVQGNDERTKRVAGRTNLCCELILMENPAWIKQKAKIVCSNSDLQNISGALGEIRAFGELLAVWRKRVRAGESGSDFRITSNERDIQIEVFTPQYRTKRSRIEYKPVKSTRITSQITECFPFGWPQRRGQDNVQGEAVSKLAAIKQDEHQFAEDGINLLWCDLQDPALWPLGFGRNQFAPLSVFQEQITSGAFWNAFYAQKGTPVFDNLPVGGYGVERPYIMEFPGRFWRNTKLDFVIADISTNKIVFQNPNRNRDVPDWLFQDLHCISAFDLEASWLDWPSSGQLERRVAIALDSIVKYAMAFRMPPR